MMALARDIPAANASTHAGKWEKNRFMGVELYGKTLGLIGCGNIGSIVADRAKGLKMRVVAFDPYLSPERATDLGVEKVEFDELLARADFISLHTPADQRDEEHHLGRCDREDEKGRAASSIARAAAWWTRLRSRRRSNRASSRALPSTCSPRNRRSTNALFGNDKVVSTPHLGASTSEAQENVALQVAEQISDYLLTGAVTNALNMPSISSEEAQRIRPWISLAEKLGAFAGQLTESSIAEVEIVYEGTPAGLNTRALTQAALCGLLKPALSRGQHGQRAAGGQGTRHPHLGSAPRPAGRL